MAFMACVFVGLRRQLRRDLGAAVPSAELPARLQRWERVMGRMALLNAGSWALAIPLTHGSGHEFRLFIYLDRKSTRLNSSHLVISYAVFCLKKKKKITD